MTIALAILALYSFGRFGIDQIRPPGLIPNDYIIFHRASERLASGIQVYQADDPSPFKYSPAFILLFSETLGRLPPSMGWYVWCLISILGFTWGTHWLWTYATGRQNEKFGGKKLSRASLAMIAAAFTVASWHGYIEYFSYGQGDMIIFGLFIAAVAAPADWIAALAMSAALAMKPQSGILLAAFLVTRRFRMLGWTGLLTTLALFFPAIFWGWERLAALFQAWGQVLARQDATFMTGNLNQSLAATMARLTSSQPAVHVLTTLIVAVAGVASALLAAFRPWRTDRIQPRNPALLITLALTMYSIASPLSWRWLTFYWLPCGFVLAMEFRKTRDRPALALLLLFVLNGLFIQKLIASAFGITEVDELSRIGLYTLGNLLLSLAAVRLALGKATKE